MPNKQGFTINSSMHGRVLFRYLCPSKLWSESFPRFVVTDQMCLDTICTAINEQMALVLNRRLTRNKSKWQTTWTRSLPIVPTRLSRWWARPAVSASCSSTSVASAASCSKSGFTWHTYIKYAYKHRTTWNVTYACIYRLHTLCTTMCPSRPNNKQPITISHQKPTSPVCVMTRSSWSWHHHLSLTSWRHIYSTPPDMHQTHLSVPELSRKLLSNDRATEVTSPLSPSCAATRKYTSSFGFVDDPTHRSFTIQSHMSM